MNLQYIKKKFLFAEWQNEYIGNISRGKAISIFIRDGLLPLIYNNGYALTKNTIQMEDTIASMMFEYSLNKNVIYRVSDINISEDHIQDYDYYCNVITYDMWDRFWKKWNSIYEDMFHYEESFGAQLEAVIWECIDLKKSPKYLQYIEDSYESEDEQEKKKEDPYLLDTRNEYMRY